jgi:hypothetical protein
MVDAHDQPIKNTKRFKENILLMYCCITNHPKIQYFKTIFLMSIISLFGDLAGQLVISTQMTAGAEG